MRQVAVFDSGLPPGISFIRSLGRARVPIVAYGDDKYPVGRFSRYVDDYRPCPHLHDTDAFVDWLTNEISSGAIDLVAPTSDYIAFHAAEAFGRLGHERPPGWPSTANLHDCLFKDRFAAALDAIGFPTPPTRSPSTIDEAVVAAEELGYPLVLKPRSHVGIGLSRGVVVTDEHGLRQAFVPYELHGGQDTVVAVDPLIGLPILQKYIEFGTSDVVSVTGFLDDDGELSALGHCRKTAQWPPRLGVGTQFEALGTQPFTDEAVAAVRSILGRGVFELEVLVDRTSGDHWAIDLNPRGFGQMALDIASGRDLARLWYHAATGTKLPPDTGRRKAPNAWRMGFPYYAGVSVQLATKSGRQRRTEHGARHSLRGHVGPVWDPRDPMPVLVWTGMFMRHPGGLVRPFLNDDEMVADDPSVATE